MYLDRKRLIFLSRLMVIITIAYIMLLGPEKNDIMRFWGYAFIAFYLATNLIVYYLPERFFSYPPVFYCIVLVDCLLIVAGIYLSRMEGSDLYLVFFVIVSMATLGSELKKLMITSFLFVVIYGWLLYQQGLLQGSLATSYILRLPFIMVVSLFLGYIVDLQTRAQKDRLETTEIHYRSFVDNLPISIYQLSTEGDGRFFLINKAFKDLFGYEEKDIKGVDAGILYTDQKQWQDMYRMLGRGKSVEGYPMNLRRRDGSVFNANIWARKYIYEKNEIVEGAIIDVTELRRTERALAESEERLRLAGKASYDLVYEWKVRDNRWRWFGDIDEKLGYDFGAISDGSETWLNLIHPDDREKRDNPEKINQANMEVNVCEYRIKHKDGSWRYWSDHRLPVTDETGDVIKWVGVCTDITRNKEMERQLQQAQKMEAIGVLAGGVAHNFNNMLMGIMGHVSAMLMDKTAPDPDYEQLKSIDASIRAAAALTRNLLGFARGGNYEVLPFNVNELIREENFIFSGTNKIVRIHEELADDIWTIEADRNQIQQVLMNLYVNAVQAMPEMESGDIYIRTENIRLNDNAVSPLKMPPGKYVKISVRDTGRGMDEKILGKIFDPFFTTKKPGEGTGLGLASVYGIVTNHKGFIEVASKVGSGSTFTIYLPASDKAITAKEEKDKPAKAIKGSGTVLIVDDEEMVVKSCERLLKRLNYKVLKAHNGREAIAAYKQKSDAIDLVMLDMLMPDMSGGIVFEEIKKINPRANVLLSSGFSLNDQARDILARGGRGFIQKPFDINELSRKISDIMRTSA